MTDVLTVKNLSHFYNDEMVLDNISFTANAGQIIGIIGPNGAGKSTLLKAILDLEKQASGEVTFFGKALSRSRKKIAYIPQRHNLDWDFPITVLDTVLLGCYPRLKTFQRPTKSEKELALRSLEKVGLNDFTSRQISELSGGQQQRVFVARALAQKAEILFLDEPFAGIDLKSEERIIEILQDLRNQGKTILIIHHDLLTVADYFDELILLNKRLIAKGPVEKVFTDKFLEKTFDYEYKLMKEVVKND